MTSNTPRKRAKRIAGRLPEIFGLPKRNIDAVHRSRKSGLLSRWPTSKRMYAELISRFGFSQAMLGYHMGVVQQTVSIRLKSNTRPVYVEAMRAEQIIAVHDAQILIETKGGNAFCTKTTGLSPTDFLFHLAACPQCLAYSLRMAEYAPPPAFARANWKHLRGANRTTEQEP